MILSSILRLQRFNRTSRTSGFVIILTIALSPIWTPYASAQEVVPATAIEKARAMIHEAFEAHDYPGMAVSVWSKGKLVWSEGFGYSDIGDRIAVSPSESLFRIGSISKSLTAAGLARLVAEHDFDLDAPIQTYVPYFPEKRWTITTRQVAQHTAGIRHYRGFEFFSIVHYDHVRDALSIFSGDTLLFKPGSDYAYSSYGWNLVSAAIEGGSGMPFIEFMESQVFTPLGMEHTFADDINLTDLNRVTFYDYINDENAVSPDVDNSIKWAGGGFLSTSEDLIRFGAGIQGNTIVDAGTTAMFWKPATLDDGTSTNYGLGWSSGALDSGESWVGHGGGSVGGSSMFAMFPDEELIVVLLINRTRASAQPLAFKVAKTFLEEN